MARYEVNPALIEYLQLGRDRLRSQEALDSEFSAKALRVAAFSVVIYAFDVARDAPHKGTPKDQWFPWVEQNLGWFANTFPPSLVVLIAFGFVVALAAFIVYPRTWKKPGMGEAAEDIRSRVNPAKIIWNIAGSYRQAVEYNKTPLTRKGIAFNVLLGAMGIQVLSAIALG